MINDILMAMVGPIVTLVIAAIVSWIIFRTNQQNKNTAMDTKFENIDKDITKNDERLRREISDQNDRNEKEFIKIDAQHDNLTSNVNTMMQSDVETKATMGHFGKTLDSMSEKIDLIFKSVIDREPR